MYADDGIIYGSNQRVVVPGKAIPEYIPQDTIPEVAFPPGKLTKAANIQIHPEKSR